MSRNAIPRAARGFFFAVSAFNSEATRARLEPAQLRSALDEALLGQEAEVRSAGVDAALYMEARYAMVALADDLALHSDWDHADDWSRDLLELRYFNTSFAGTEFFDRLYTLRQRLAGTQDPRLRDQVLGVIEIYHACIRLGFQGRYRRGQSQELEGIARSALTLLWPEGEAGLRRRLWEPAYAEAGTGAVARRSLLWWWPIPVSAMLVVGAWFLFFFHQKDRVGGIVERLHGQVEKSLPAAAPGDGTTDGAPAPGEGR